jgi:alanyl-tRNA synthetase
LKDKLKTAVIVLAVVDGGRVQLAAGVTSDTTPKAKAAKLVNHAPAGRPRAAASLTWRYAGGSDPSCLGDALASVQRWVAERVWASV